ncbi:MAG: Verru_Chthon cassette protein A [Chthoniobacter sp.]|nr:Verru_Chthon cassette protein A [Chthoniobacter sp.]
MKLPKHSVSGVALVIVLGFLVIISALAVAFFSSVNTELKASRNFAAGMTTRQLADSAVQVVMGQIAAATTRGVDVNGTGLGNEAWASQPGLIRVYGTNLGTSSTASSSADAFYKLYSSSKMILTGSDLNNFSVGGKHQDYSNPDNDAYNAWDAAPALWTDLNAPVLVRDPSNPQQAVPRFPIIDPRVYVSNVDTTTPWSDTKWDKNVEGFTYDASAVHGAVGAGNGDKQRLPMPVRWVYVLQDGTLTTPTSSGTTTATFTTNIPTAQNPIVGRIAFWTDDETCKLNLNTAAGFTGNVSQLNSGYQSTPSAYAGSYWDTPRFYTQFDYGIPDQSGMPQGNQASGGLALCQLLQNEFQRYPGHPATTSLAPVLNNLLTSEQLYAIVPRYSNLNMQSQPSSTVGGTQRIIVDPVNTPGDLDNKQLQPKQDRLYASVDEFLFGAHVSVGNFSTPNYTRITNNVYANLTNNPITPDLVDKLRFFVTTQSRAPELNLFGQPRISCWPVRAESPGEVTGLNVFDNLILFCSTVGGANATTNRPDTKSDLTSSGIYRYIFTRRELPTNQSTGQITNATQISHPDPIGGGPAQKQYELNSSGYTADCETNRNKLLMGTYLLGTANPPGLLNRPIPGVGQALSAKYNAADTQGIVTEIFDYIRLANSQDTTTSIAPPAKTIKFAPRGYVIPSQPSYLRSLGTQAKGFGRMSTLCEVALDFYYAGPQMDTSFSLASAPANTGWSKWDPAATSYRYAAVQNDASGKPRVKGGYMRAFLLFSTFDPMQGYAPKVDPGNTDPKLSIEAKWPQDWTVQIAATGQTYPMGFPANTSSSVVTTAYRSPVAYWGGRQVGGYEGFMHTLMGSAPATIGVTPSGQNWIAPQKIMWDHKTYLTSADIGITTSPSGSSGNAFTNITAANAAAQEEYYPFQTDIGKAIPIPGPAVVDPTQINDARNYFTFNGGALNVTLYYGSSATNPGLSTFPALQTFNLNFPRAQKLPIPQGPPFQQLNPVKPQLLPPANGVPTADVTTWAAVPLTGDTNFNSPGPSAGNQGGGMHTWYWTGNGAFFANAAASFVRAKPPTFGVYNYYTSLQASWSFATRLAWVTAPGNGPGGGGISYDPYTNSSGSPIAPGYFADRWRCIVQPGDTIRSLLYWDSTNAATKGPLTGMGVTAGGDLRIGQLTGTVPASSFREHPDYNGSQSRACVLRGGDGNPYFPIGNVNPPTTNGSTGTQLGTAGAPAYILAVNDPTKEASLGNHITLPPGNPPWRFQESRAFANLPWGALSNVGAVNGIVRADGQGQNPGDFDTGLGDFADGPFCNKQDEGNVIYRYLDYNNKYIYPIPYFTATWSYQAPGNTFTSPSRQMPSAGMFGSLPSQVPEGKGWQTLCFCPNTAGPNHPGNVDPKDHYLLDLFMMPIVEPYPISEPFSTAGKVNLNYRIVPFDYIRRSTALRGALYPLRLTAVNSQASQPAKNANFMTYKVGQLDGNGNTILDSVTGNPAPLTTNFRLQLDRDQTIAAFDEFYDEGAGQPDAGFFKSASQICERYLYARNMSRPSTTSAEAAYMKTWWSTNGDLTGDNEREKPYTDLYPRITTKSNTYTVHMRVQTLRQARSGPAADYSTWIEGKDNVLGEYRGSATIERYVDPADQRFSTSYANSLNPDKASVEPLYHFRTVITKKFTP